MFYLITQQQGISSTFDGIIGMSRDNLLYKNGPILYDYLYKAGTITDNIFAFYLGDANTVGDDSYCELGGYTTTKFKSGESITYFPAVTHFFWILEIEGYRFGESDTFSDGTYSSFASPNTTIGIMDTGTSFMYIPNGLYSKFVLGLMKDLDYTQV